MKIYIVCSERSGDQHVAALVGEIRKQLPNAAFRGVGGNALTAEGVPLFLNYKEINFMGVWEVLRNSDFLLKKIREIVKDIKEFKPDAVVFVDSSSLNIRIAKLLAGIDVKKIYYIAPKIWAWNTKRVHSIKALFDKIFVIFPFEIAFYKKYKVDAFYTGNPSYEAISKHLAVTHGVKEQNVIALLPGSRRQEVQTTLPIYKALVRRFPDWTFKIAGVSNLQEFLYSEILSEPNVSIGYDQSFEILSDAVAAVVVSGTATFEAALLNVPQVVVYKTSWLTYLVGRIVIKVPYISLVNLVAEEEVVKELIQDKFNLNTTEAELRKILPGGAGREAMLTKYLSLKAHLGPKNASERAAKEIVNYLAQ